jgi:hypothetical protein
MRKNEPGRGKLKRLIPPSTSYLEQWEKGRYQVVDRDKYSDTQLYARKEVK